MVYLASNGTKREDVQRTTGSAVRHADSMHGLCTDDVGDSDTSKCECLELVRLDGHVPVQETEVPSAITTHAAEDAVLAQL